MELIVAQLARGARAAGFATERWTSTLAAIFVERVTGVRHHPTHVTRVFRKFGVPGHVAWWRQDSRGK